MREEKAQKALQEILRRAFGTRLPVRVSASRPGAVTLDIVHGAKPQRLVAHWVQGWPRDVGTLLARVGEPWPRDHVVLSERLSPGAIALLDRAGASWGEATGRARIRTRGGLAIHTSDRPPDGPTPARSSALVWSPARADVAEILLARRAVPRLVELKRLTGWSVPQIGQTLRAFDGAGWTGRAGTARGIGATRTLSGWEPMLESWAAYLATVPAQRIAAHATYRDPLRYVETTLARAWTALRWAVSGWAGLQLTAPYVTSVPLLHLYVDVEHFHTRLPGALRAAGLREVSEGARVEIRPARAALFAASAPQRGGVRVVHPARLYADLLALGDRGREAALHVREELLDDR